VTWSGRFRPPLRDQGIYPRHEQLPISVAVGGTPASIVRAAERGLPVTLAIIGGDPERFAPLANLYRRTLVDSGRSRCTPTATSPTVTSKLPTISIRRTRWR
jgi:alkanesulfonate monooxygenase SsuD/methylene tetrahydromethanopterin reductase-like flavin-dependent oxidoreductase (luciferase family)